VATIVKMILMTMENNQTTNKITKLMSKISFSKNKIREHTMLMNLDHFTVK